MKKIQLFILLLILFASCKRDAEKNYMQNINNEIYQEVKTSALQEVERDYWPIENWRIISPQNNIDWSLIDNEVKNQLAILIVKNGYIAFEKYTSPYTKESKHHIHSCTKSIVSILLGISIKEGFILSVNEKVVNFFTDYKIKNRSYLKETVTLSHLLTMTSGLKWRLPDEKVIGSSVLEKLQNSSNWTEFILNQPMVREPGSSFEYNSGNSQLLAAIIQSSTGTSLDEFAQIYLFEPLGIKQPKWWRSPEGIPTAGWGMFLTVQDMAKLGYLYLNNGKWEKNQIVSRQYVDNSAMIQATSLDFRKGWKYGYQWWIPPGFDTVLYTASGSYDTHHVYITVVPEYDLVCVFAGNITDSKYLEYMSTIITINKK